jgi:hypothetical protein
MTWSRGIPLALAFGIIISSARPISCQQLRQLEMGVLPARASLPDSSPSGFATALKTLRWSVPSTLLGGMVGFGVDQVYCSQHHSHDPSFLFGPCTFYASGGSAVGWFGGAILGSTFAAAHVAQKRGCPQSAALLRAAAGAVIGAAPGSIIVASGSGNYPPSKSMFIAAAPFLAGLGAAAAVIGCHGT